jgi:hypothetical protein
MKFLHFISVLFIALTFSFEVKSQNITINRGIDTSSNIIKKSINFYKSYIDAVKGNKDIKRFWETSETDGKKTKYLIDPMAYTITKQLSIYQMSDVMNILNLRVENNIVAIKTLFGWLNEKDVTVMCITNHYIKFNGSNPIFVNADNFQPKEWISRNVKNVSFHYPKDVAFKLARAKKLTNSIKEIQKHWDINEQKINYYYADKAEDIDRLRGFDFVMGRSDRPSGIAYEDDNVVYCVGLGENYLHEIIHIYLGFLPNKELQEGIAIFYGGSMGNSFNQQRLEAKNFLGSNQNFRFDIGDLNESVLNNGVNMSKFIEALVCDVIYKKNGLEGLKRAMNHKSMKQAIKSELGIEEKDFDRYFKEWILTD